MYKYLDIENWNRREHFAFFRQFDTPFFGLTVELDCTTAYTFCKEKGYPFFLFYHYQAIKAANLIEEFRYRLEGDKVIIFNQIHIATTLSRPDHTFAFSFMPFASSFTEFKQAAEIEIEKIKYSTGLGLSENSGRLDVIHCSTLPWISFSQMTHAHHHARDNNEGIPKIAFGKFYTKNNGLVLPVSISVHHALIDGFHVGRFLELFQKFINNNI